MKIVHQGIRLFIIAALFVAPLSCTLWSAHQWETLSDRKFHFQRFTYYLKGGNRETAFEFMKGFPVKEVMQILAGKHNIEVDASEFEAFFAAEENRKKLKAFGIPVKERFRWESEKKQANTVEVEYANEFAYELEPVRTYTIWVKVNGRLRASYSDSIENREGVIKSLRSKYGMIEAGDKREEAPAVKTDEPKEPERSEDGRMKGGKP